MSEMKDGWFVGDFIPSAYKTSYFEVCYKKHKKNEKWDTHYHKKSIEINYLISGEMIINETKLTAGDIFLIEPYFISTPTFLEDCTLIIIKTPSIIGDKFVINE